jgi:hypothetical protein
MENQNTILNQNNPPPSLTREVREENIRSESSSEYTLPDYSPEIRKLLRVNTRLIPTRRYISLGKAEFSGNVLYNILYSGEDGTIAGTSFMGEYDFSCPIPADSGSEPSLSCASAVESCTCRLVGPRRLSLRTRIRSDVRCSSMYELSSENTAARKDGEEKLRRQSETVEIVRVGAEEFSVSDTVSLENVDTSRLFPIICDGSVRIGEVSCEQGRIRVRGEVWTKCMVSGGNDTPPMTVSRKLPFEEELYADGIDSSYACKIKSSCHGVSLRAPDGEGEDGLLEISAIYSLEAEAQRNIPVELTEDMYSCSYKSECTYDSPELTRSLCLGNRNITASTSTPLPDGISSGAEIADVGGDMRILGVSCDSDGCRIEGESNLIAVISQAGEGSSHTLSPVQARIPFKAHIPSRHAKNIDWDCQGQLLDARARIDGNNLCFDCEVALEYSVREKENGRCVSEFKCDASAPLQKRRGCITVCRPQKDESIWEVGRRLCTPIDDICEFNELSTAIRMGVEPLPEVLLIR